MELRQIRHFVGVAREGSFTKAAVALHISQPALTRSVHILEDSLNTTLFLRTHSGVELSEDGTTLFRHATLILNSLDAAENELLASAKGGYGEVRIGIASLFTNMLADRSISQCVARDSGFSAVINVGLYEQMEKSLRDGELDVVISTDTEIDPSGGLLFEPLCAVESAIIVGSQHPLAGKKDLSIKDVRNASWVTLRQPHMEAFLASFFAQFGVAAPKSRVRTQSLEMLRRLIRQNHLLGFVPLHWIPEDLKAGRLVSLPVEHTPIRRMAGIITRKEGLLNAGAKLLVNELREVAAEIAAEETTQHK